MTALVAHYVSDIACDRVSVTIVHHDKPLQTEQLPPRMATVLYLSHSMGNSMRSMSQRLAFTRRQVFVVHGGLPMDSIVTLADINSVDRRMFQTTTAAFRISNVEGMHGCSGASMCPKCRDGVESGLELEPPQQAEGATTFRSSTAP